MSSKRYRAWKEKVEADRRYPMDEGLELVTSMKGERYDQSVEVALRLGIDAKQSDQQVRGAVNLPHGLGKKVVVVAFAKGEKENEAREAGADFIGGDDLQQKIADGWFNFDKIVSTPEMMPTVSKLGKVLGPRGLMPNPKTGTVTPDIGKAVRECKMGKAMFKTDKAGIVHCAIGKASFGSPKIKENLMAFLEGVVKLKPPNSKGIFLKGLSLSVTTGPGVCIDLATTGLI